MASGFETVPIADLETLRDNIVLALGRSLNSISYQIGGRTLTRAGLKDLRELLREVTQEIASRSNQDGGIILIEFGEPV